MILILFFEEDNGIKLFFKGKNNVGFNDLSGLNDMEKIYKLFVSWNLNIYKIIM